LDESRVCAEGGAIGLGHPWGASGTILLLRLMSRLLDPAAAGSAGSGLGLAACAIGGGQGLAMVLAHPEA
jgi:acetyl-CoA C-acetyltransferase